MWKGLPGQRRPFLALCIFRDAVYHSDYMVAKAGMHALPSSTETPIGMRLSLFDFCRIKQTPVCTCYHTVRPMTQPRFSIPLMTFVITRLRNEQNVVGASPTLACAERGKKNTANPGLPPH